MEYQAETIDVTNQYINDPNSIIQGGLFNINDFNKAYNIMKENKKKIIQNTDITYLNQLNEQENVKHTYIYNQNIYEILINLKNTINNILNDLFIDLVHLRFNIHIFFKDDRIFYVGLIFIIVGLIVYLFNLLFEKS
jgi:hypothetical protein